jgi:hypothetical protein
VNRASMRGQARGLVATGALLLALASCESEGARPPQAGSNPWYPRPTACRVDAHGAVSESGDRKAQCCPEGFVVGGTRVSSCRAGECCWVGDDMGGPALFPGAPGGPHIPPS